jgi:indole-3-glycerol phosphate synthase
VSLLDEIISCKKKEVEEIKKFLSFNMLSSKDLPEIRNFKKALEREGISIIAEIKSSSPSAGIIRKNMNYIRIAKLYEDNGASAVSVLTDKNFFGGNNNHLKAIKKEVSLPILRKDFIIDKYQIYESRYIGADAILLIARILTPEQIEQFIQTSKKLGLCCLVEVHKSDELEKVLITTAEIIGINNRDLDTLQINLNNSLRIKKMIPDGYLCVSESGIKKREDILKLKRAGFDGILIGETLLKNSSPGNKLKKLLGGKV